jgi:enterochelin esterase-like enzyme
MEYAENKIMTVNDNRFQNLCSAVAALEDPAKKATLVDEFIASLDETNYPILENDTTAVVLYRQSDRSVSVISDITDMAEAVPMEQVPGTDLYYTRIHARADARIEYFFITDDRQIPFADPLNGYRVNYGVWISSELAMPAYVRDPLFEPFMTGKPGSFDRVVGHVLNSSVMGYSRIIHVYLPSGYGEENSRYPVIYFQDGSDYIEFAYVPHVLDQLIGQKRIRPVIAVFVTPPNRHQPEMPNRMTEYGMNNDYVAFFTDELVSFIDSEYRTISDPAERLVVGDSYGGLISLYIALCRPEIFGAAYSQSGYVSFQNDKLISLFQSSPVKPVRLFVDVGLYERNVGALFLPAGETDFLEGNRRFNQVLESKGFEHVYREYPEGHTWGNWRGHLVDALEYFFGI